MNLLLLLIKFYQKTVKIREVFLKSFFGATLACRFQPTCSQYCYQAIAKYGMMLGSWKCFKRIVRCNPFCKGGNDPLE